MNEPTERAPADRRTHVLRRLTSGLVIVSTLGFGGYYLLTHEEEVEPLLEFPLWMLGVVLVLQVVYLVPQAGRYRLVLERRTETVLSRAVWFRLFVVGRLMNTVIPQSGNFYRSLRLRSAASMGVASYVGGFLTFAWLSLCLSLLLALATILTFNASLEIADARAAWVLLVTFAIVSLSPYAISKLMMLIPGSIDRLDHLVSSARRVIHEALRLPTDPRFTTVFISLSAGAFAVAVAIVFLIFQGLSADIGLAEAAVFLALLQASSVVNLTPSNLGVQEIGFAALAAGLGISLGTGLLAASLIRVSGVAALLTAAAGTQPWRASAIPD